MTLVDRSDCTAPDHGDAFAYRARGCRCPDARELYRIYRKRLREHRHTPAYAPAIGTARRLRSLVASGHSQAALARRLGMTRNQVNRYICARRPSVTPLTEQRVKDLFRQLDGTDGGSRYARTSARSRGWVDAAAWDNIDDPTERPKLGAAWASIVDEVKVMRAINGEPMRLTPRESRAAVEILTRRLWSQAEIADRLRISKRRVCSQRANARRLAA